jgi:hypothetical protein
MRTLLVSLVLLALPAFALAQEKKPEEKKAAAQKKAQKKPAAKSDKNVFQKAESAVGDAAQRSKIWTKSEPRGQATK